MRRLAIAALCAWLATANAQQPMVLALRVNGEDHGEVFVQQMPDGDFLVKAEDLAAAGLAAGDAPVQRIDGEAHISLRALRGVTYAFDTRELRLALQADPSLLPRKTIDLGDRRRMRVTAPEGVSGFVNYSLEYSRPAGLPSQALLSTEAGVRAGSWLLLGNGTTVPAVDGGRSFVRLMTSAIRDDAALLRRWVVGDFFVAPPELGNGANLGGISLTKLYSLDPYQLRYPLGNLRAQIALPSDVDVIVDGQRVRTERVRPGEVEIRDLYGYGGARSVQLVVRDAFGRVQQLDYSTYFSDQPLRQGLHEYSYNLGALRRDYGVASNHYGPAAYSLVHRYGVTDAVTLGFSAEGRRGVTNAGPLATMVLGNAGVASIALAASEAQGRRGWAAALHYSYQRRNFSAGFSLRRDSAGYAMLTDPLTVFNRKYEATLGATYSFGARGSVSVNHSRLAVHDAVPLPGAGWQLTQLEPRRVTTVGYTAPVVPGRASLAANVSHVNDRQGSHNEFAVNLTVFMDGYRTARAGTQRIGDVRLDTLEVMQPPPIGEGWGWDVVAERASSEAGEGLQLKAAAQLNLPQLLVRAEAGRLHSAGDAQDNYRLTAAGSVAFIGGGLHFGRPVTDSFALVRVAGLAGVPTTLNGQPVGKTDARGEVFVPTLASYYENQLAIDPGNLPIEYAVSNVMRKVAPALRSGVVVDFEARRMQAVTGSLVDGAGAPLPLAQLEMQAGGRSVRATTGRSGEIYLENLGAGVHEGQARVRDASCRFRIDVPARDDLFVDIGAVVCR